MAIRQAWKYEKDFFGKRHRKYYFENIFGADVADMKTFRALKIKLERDYLAFFGGLNKSYQRGEFKKLAKESVDIALATISILDYMIDSGAINDETIGAVATNVGNLNASKDFFISKSKEVKALKDRMGQVESETGVSAEALNISKEAITSGAKREKKKLKEGVLPFLGRTAPRTAALGGQLARAGAAALGPAYPIAQVAGGALSDIFGIGRGIAQKVGERRERKLGRALQPMAHALPQASLRGVGQARVTGAVLPKVVEQRKKVGQATLTEFFNKGAFRAKWTRQLLKSMKKAGTGRGFGLGGLVGKFKGLAAVLLPLLGKAGLIAALGLVSAGAADRLSKLGSKFIELGEVTTNVRKALQKQAELQRKFNAKIDAITAAKRAAFEKTGKEAVGITSIFMDKMQTREDLLKIAPSIIKNPFILPSSDETTKIEQGRRGRRMDLSTAPTSPGSPRDRDIVGVDRLSSAIDALTKKLGEESRTQATIKESGIGNPFDSADPWINNYAGANLELN
jgi:outer membrane murein-binding lipoprotein Lpp